VREMKKSKTILIGVLLLLAFTGVASASNGKIAVMESNTWDFSDGYPITDYLNQERSIISALDYYGYKYDVLEYETTTNETLAAYDAVIAVYPVGGSAGNLIVNFTQVQKKYVLAYNSLDASILSAFNMTWNSSGAASDVTDVGSLTGDMVSGMDALPVYYVANYTYDPSTTVYARTTSGVPILTSTTVNGGTLVVYPTRITSTSYNNYRMIKNFIDLATNTKPFVTGSTPYAQDLAVLIRYDDYMTDTTGFNALYNITHECTVGATLNLTTAAALARQPECEFVPHAYQHLNLTALTYDDVLYQFTEGKSVQYNYVGYYPTGLICPFNLINDNVTRAAKNAGGYDWITWTGSSVDDACYYYTSDSNMFNDVWVLGDEGGVMLKDLNSSQEVLEKVKTTRGSWMILDHPAARVAEGSLTATVAGLRNLINNSTQTDGIYFSKVSDYVKYLQHAKNVHLNDTILTVNSSVPAGLTLANVNKPVVVDGKATIIFRTNKTMLPALNAGTYEVTYSEDYPKILSYTNGSLISDGYYDITSDIMYFSIHDDDEMYNITNVTVAGYGYSVISVRKNSDIIYSYSNNDSAVITNLTEGNYTVSKIPFVITPNVNDVNITVKTWSTARKIWTESSESHNTVTEHIIGGFPANTLIQINRDGVKYETVESDSTGTIVWTYDGGFSEHEFEAFVADTTEVMSTNVSNGIWQSSLGMILVAVVVFFGTMLYQGVKKGKLESDTIILAAKGLLSIAMTLMVGAIILSAF
jgi:hypothetical protein